jgi:hypothetical protein
MVMEAVRTSETSVCFNDTTRRYIPEGCHFHTRRRENLKSHNSIAASRITEFEPAAHFSHLIYNSLQLSAVCFF